MREFKWWKFLFYMFSPSFWKLRNVDHIFVPRRYTNEEAFELMNQGVWMRSGGYTWRNVYGFLDVTGQYWAYGKYPECVRSSYATTLEHVRQVGHDDWVKVEV